MNSLFQTVTNSKDEDTNVVPLTPSRCLEQKIIIKDLTLNMPIGVLEKEKGQTQRVIVNLELDVTPQDNWVADEINNVVSYADIIEMIQSMVADHGHINLVETFAEMVIQKCFESKMVLAVSVSVEKPDIILEAGSVGVKISRQK
jgi:dihydroneopterin aldolase